MILSKKVFRFPVPGSKVNDLLANGGENPQKVDTSKLWFESKPGPDPQPAPAWIKDTTLWDLASQDGDVFEVKVANVRPSQKDLAVAAAAAQAEAAKVPEGPDLSAMKKADLLEHAASEHDLELSDSLTKDEIIKEIQKAQKG